MFMSAGGEKDLNNKSEQPDLLLVPVVLLSTFGLTASSCPADTETGSSDIKLHRDVIVYPFLRKLLDASVLDELQ